ncbi:DUF6111 family protein [Pseudovibrio exalbescens]|uniref:DUF6111 family protein n=1 Tax=Pseudovibrio exalbescens TaxID=197461 RepID=UPI00040C5A72|nr:DUF6111 family protein [Pseudovibrio exalbescens]
MLRILITHGLLFLVPFIGYAIWLYLGKKAQTDKKFRDGPIAWLAISGLALVAASFIIMASVGYAPQGSQYRPAQIIDGVFVPGGYEEPNG